MTAPRNAVSVLCRFWQEDAVWNGEARDLPIAVFGATFEEAEHNLRDAIIGHLEAAAELGMIDEIISSLRRSEQESIAVEAIPADSPLLRLLIAVERAPGAAAHR